MENLPSPSDIWVALGECFEAIDARTPGEGEADDDDDNVSRRLMPGRTRVEGEKEKWTDSSCSL